MMPVDGMAMPIGTSKDKNKATKQSSHDIIKSLDGTPVPSDTGAANMNDKDYEKLLQMNMTNMQTIQEQQQLLQQKDKIITQLQTQAAANTWQGDTILFEDYAEDWFKTRKQLVRPTTWQKNRIYYNAHLLPAFKGMTLMQLDKRTLQKVFDELGQTHAPATMKIIKSTMSLILDDAMEADLIPKNYMKVVKIKQGESNHKRALTQDEIRRLSLAVEHERLWIILYLGLGTGMRPEEMLGLKWSCVDFANKCIHVEETYTRDAKSKPHKGDTKTKGSKRDIAIGDTLVACLKRYQKEQRTSYGCKTYVLSTRRKGKDEQLHPKTLDNLKYKWRKKAGIPDFTLYMLRHTYASIASEGGVPMVSIMRQMGHSTTKMLETVYIHQRTNKDQYDCASVVDNIAFSHVS